MPAPRNTRKYVFKDGNKIVWKGISERPLEDREAEHKKKWPKGHIVQVGRATTDEAARQWEEEQGVS